MENRDKIMVETLIEKTRKEAIRSFLLKRLKIDGWKQSSIQLKLSEGIVRKWAKKFKIEGPPDQRGSKPTNLTEEQKSIIYNMYPQISTSKIAPLINSTNDIVIGFIKRNGKYVGFNRRADTSVDKSFFKWSNDLAYVLGYMWADGTTGKYFKKGYGRKDRIMPICGISSKDKQILDDIRIRMGLKAKPCPCVVKGKTYWALSTNCVWVYEKFKRYGLIQRKSFVGVGIPKIPKRFVRHFVRGFFDGDGTRSKDGYRMGFGCTDKRFMVWLKCRIIEVVGGKAPKISKTPNKTTFFSFNIYAQRARKLYKWMSPNGIDLRLIRKWSCSTEIR
jgi:hypothetical protein